MANDINAASVNAAQPQTIAEGTVKQFSVKVMRVQLFDDADIVNVQLTFDKAIPGFVRDADGNFVEADTNVVSRSRSAITKELCDCDESIALLRDGQKAPLSRAQFSTILHGATIVLERTYHVEGFVPEGRDALVRDQWFTTIANVKLSEMAKQLIQQVVIQRMMNDDK